MKDWKKLIDTLDISIFNGIESQTSDGCRKSLLGVQRAMAEKSKEYSYLEIGSHLGGTIQPHLLDERCTIIYSIDPRPAEQMDDRNDTYIATYENNTTERMISELKNIGNGNVNKINCFEKDASDVEKKEIKTKPDIFFIDGEHTNRAVLSDFDFCNTVSEGNGIILFHDFYIVYSSVIEICKSLQKNSIPHMALKLEGSVFAIFFDKDMVYSDSYLYSIYKKNKNFLLNFHIRQWFKKFIPQFLIRFIRGIVNLFRNNS